MFPVLSWFTFFRCFIQFLYFSAPLIILFPTNKKSNHRKSFRFVLLSFEWVNNNRAVENNNKAFILFSVCITVCYITVYCILYICRSVCCPKLYEITDSSCYETILGLCSLKWAGVETIFPASLCFSRLSV